MLYVEVLGRVDQRGFNCEQVLWRHKKRIGSNVKAYNELKAVVRHIYLLAHQFLTWVSECVDFYIDLFVLDHLLKGGNGEVKA